MKNAAREMKPVSLLGVRFPLWEVMVVIIGAALGAILGGAIYSPSTTVGAMVGVLVGPTVTRFFAHSKYIGATQPPSFPGETELKRPGKKS